MADLPVSSTLTRTTALSVAVVLGMTACQNSAPGPSAATSGAAETSTDLEATAVLPDEPAAEGPRVLSVENSPSVANFGRIDVSVELTANFDNPFDQRQVALDATFRGPDGSEWFVPGFWDGRASWQVRFTPSVVGVWTYDIRVTDRDALSPSVAGTFSVEPSDAPGWLWPGDWVDPSYSPRYFAHLDGTPWFGLGHADLGMGFDGFNGTTFEKMVDMQAAGENFEMWWPLWTFNFIQNSHDDYQASQMELIDLVLREAEANNISIAYTIWNHQLLRTNNHRWGRGLWGSNGFNDLVEIDGFFTDPEAWAWQENLYRYTIARWGCSPAIAMWQTVTEINGTESYDHTDTWHEAVNQYFIDHDPYRHPTSATKSGGEYWPQAHAVMDVPQMHVYEQFHQNPVEAARIMADWTQQMWLAESKPNWIGEYGERSPRSYPEFFHNASWATIAAGGALGPIEWNDKNSYGQFDDAMAADQARLRTFLDTLDLVRLRPEQLAVTSSHPTVRGWGVAGTDGGLVWVQDFSLEAESFDIDEDIDAIRGRPELSNVSVSIDGLAAGRFRVTPFDTWAGEWLDPLILECEEGVTCAGVLPTFGHDLALQIVRA